MIVITGFARKTPSGTEPERQTVPVRVEGADQS